VVYVVGALAHRSELAGVNGGDDQLAAVCWLVEGVPVTGEGLSSYTVSRQLRCVQAHARRCYGEVGPRRGLVRRSSGEVTAAKNQAVWPYRCSDGSMEGMARWRGLRQGFVRLG
jgi:hypothetical protein